eukprot:10194595-Alexandrium_andersonii.AAC.1
MCPRPVNGAIHLNPQPTLWNMQHLLGQSELELHGAQEKPRHCTRSPPRGASCAGVRTDSESANENGG